MEFTIKVRNREALLAQALQAKLHLRDICLWRCESDGAGPPVRSVEPVRLSAEIDSEVESQSKTD